MTRKGIGMSREHQLTHQLTCRMPQTPSHCDTGSVVDVTAIGFPVTDECSRLCLPQQASLPLGYTLGEDRSLTRHVCLPPVERARLACSYCMRSQPRGGTPQQAHACSGSLHHWTSLSTVMYCRRHTQRVYRPAGRKGERRAVR